MKKTASNKRSPNQRLLWLRPILAGILCICATGLHEANGAELIPVSKAVTPGDHDVFIRPPTSPTNPAVITVTIKAATGWTLVSQETTTSVGWSGSGPYQHSYDGKPWAGYPQGVFKGKLERGPDCEKPPAGGGGGSGSGGAESDKDYTVTSKGSPTGYFIDPPDLTIVCVGEPAKFTAYRWNGDDYVGENSSWTTNGFHHANGTSITFPAGTSADVYNITATSTSDDTLSDTATLIVVEVVSITPEPTIACYNSEKEFQVETYPAGHYDKVSVTGSNCTIMAYDTVTGKVTVKFDDVSTHATDYKIVTATCGTSSVQAELIIIKVDLIPDYDRSGVIDEDDRAKANAGDTFYFWINDDDDDGFEDDSKAGKQDIPGAVSGWLEFDGRTPDHDDNKIDGIRDMVDFFPVFVDLKDTLDLIGTTDLKYVLKHTDSAVKAYIATDLAAADAGKHLRDHAYITAHDDETVQEITASGYEFPAAFLTAVKDDNKGVILLEGVLSSTSGKLVLEVQMTDGTVICSKELALSLDGVEKMFFHKNIRSAAGGTGGGADRSTAPNWPDDQCNGKHFVFVHGYNVNAQAARGWHAEIFKRMYWSQSNARFHAITWFGEESQIWTWWSLGYYGYKTPNYHINVFNAWKSAPALKDYLASPVCDGDVYIAAHSLGNMLASYALTLNSSLVDLCFMLNAAVASEAYDPSMFAENMLHKDWLPYESSPNRLYASEWYSHFGSSDHRNDLTWQGRFSSIVGKCVNLYSTGDQVFDDHPKNVAPEIFEVIPHIKSGRYSWAYQEKRKGSSSFSGGDEDTFSKFAGWSFNDEDPPDGWTEENPDYDSEDPFSEEYVLIGSTDAAAIPESNLVSKPFFGMGADDFRSNLFQPDTVTANSWLDAADSERIWRIIAGAIPAMSFAAGHNSIGAVSDNVNMDSLKPSYWPSRGSYGQDWLHSDIKNMAYIYTFKVFDKMVNMGGLNDE